MYNCWPSISIRIYNIYGENKLQNAKHWEEERLQAHKKLLDEFDILMVNFGSLEVLTNKFQIYNKP